MDPLRMTGYTTPSNVSFQQFGVFHALPPNQRDTSHSLGPGRGLRIACSSRINRADETTGGIEQRSAPVPKNDARQSGPIGPVEGVS